MPKVRVLIVDDSVTIRRLLSDAVSRDPDLEVAGTAANGRIALAKLAQCAPDVVTMDVEMPELDGISTLRELRKTHPKLPVVMFSTLTELGALTTLEALAAGASDYVTKPSGAGNLAGAMKALEMQMLPKLRMLGGLRDGALAPRRSLAPVAWAGSARAAKAPLVRPEVLAIGASTGGPNAIAALLGALPGPLAVPVVVTQHMPPLFTRLFAQRLDTTTAHRVREAADGDVLEAGLILVAPGDHHMLLVGTWPGRVVVRLDVGPPESSCRPAVDPMLRCVARIWGARSLVVILTGMGQDGMRGCEGIRDVGGQVVAQDEASSVVWGMPGFVARAGLAHAILPLEQIAGDVSRRLAGRAGLAGNFAQHPENDHADP